MAFQLIGLQLFDDNGDPLNGGLVYVYEPGTTTEKDSYPTADDADAGTNANANPVVLDSAGRGQIWGRTGEIYKLVINTSGGVLVDTIDDISGPNSQQTAIGYYVAGGSADAQTITASPPWAAYEAGSVISFKPVADNTGACTLNVSSLGAVSIKLQSGSDLYLGALSADGIATTQYDGTNFVLMTPAHSEGSVTLTYGGFSGTAPTGTLKYSRNGNAVVLYLEGVSGTSNATSFTGTGFPDHLRPTTGNAVCDCRVTDNGVTAYGFLLIPSSGDVSFRANANSSFFTASGTKGITGSGGTYIL